jgi:hypothetical protein
MIPLSFVLGYQFDMAKGNKMERIIGEWWSECEVWRHGGQRVGVWQSACGGVAVRVGV